jgi:type IV secretion system protein VirD4
MSTPRQGGALGDELANLGIIALIAAADPRRHPPRRRHRRRVDHRDHAQPTGGIEAGLGVLLHPATPVVRSVQTV